MPWCFASTAIGGTALIVHVEVNINRRTEESHRSYRVGSIERTTSRLSLKAIMEQGPRGLRGTSFFCPSSLKARAPLKCRSFFGSFHSLRFLSSSLSLFLALLALLVSSCLPTLHVGHPTRRLPVTVESPTLRSPDPPRTGLGQSSHRFSFVAILYPPYPYPRHMPHALL